MRELREELRIVVDQLDHLEEEAGDLELRALVSETPMANFESRDARKHAEAMRSHRDRIITEIAELEAKVNEYLDRMGGERP